MNGFAARRLDLGLLALVAAASATSDQQPRAFYGRAQQIIADSTFLKHVPRATPAR